MFNATTHRFQRRWSFSRSFCYSSFRDLRFEFFLMDTQQTIPTTIALFERECFFMPNLPNDKLCSFVCLEKSYLIWLNKCNDSEWKTAAQSHKQGLTEIVLDVRHAVVYTNNSLILDRLLHVLNHWDWMVCIWGAILKKWEDNAAVSGILKRNLQ